MLLLRPAPPQVTRHSPGWAVLDARGAALSKKAGGAVCEVCHGSHGHVEMAPGRYLSSSQGAMWLVAGLMRSRRCSGPAGFFMQWSGSCDLASDFWPSEKGAELDVPNLWCHIPRLTVLTRGRFSVKTLIACGGSWGPGGDTQPPTVCCGVRCRRASRRRRPT